MFSMDSLNMYAEMETEPPKNEVFHVTTALKNEFTSKIKEVEHVFKKLADVTKSHDQTKQEVRKTLCKTCRDKSYVIFKSPQKTYSDFGGQTEHQSLQPGRINGGKPDLRVEIISKEHQPREDDTPHQQELTPAKHITKLESIIQELQDNKQQGHRQVENLQATLETVEKERDDYKRQVDNQQVEIVRIRQQTNCDSDTQHAARTQSSGVASQEEKFEELVQDIGEGGDTAQHLVPGNQEHDQKIINSLRNENEGKSNEMEEYNKNNSESTENDEVYRLKKENSTLQEDRDTRDVLIKSLRDEKDKQIAKNKQLTEEKQKMEQTVNELQTQLADVNSEVNRKQCENQSLHDNQSTYKCSYNLRSRKEQEDKQTQHLEQMRQDIANLKADMEKKMTENETLAKEKSVLTKENEEIRKQMNGVQLNLQQMEGTLSQTKSKLEKTEEKNRTLTGTLTDRDAELESLTTAKDKLLSQIELAKNEKAQIQHEFDEQKDKMKKENSSITDTQNEIRKLANTLAERNREMQSAEQEKKQIRSQIERTIQERDQIQVKLDEEKQKLDSAKTKITGMQSENRNLTDILASRDEELRSVKSERDQLTSQMQDAKQKNLNVQRELDEQTKKSGKAEKQSLKAKNDIQNMTDSLKIWEERFHDLQDKHHKLKEEMKTLQQKHDQIKETLDQRTLSNRKLEEENAHLKANCATRDEELRSTKNERNKLNSQLTDSQHDKLNIRRELDEQTRKSEQIERQLLKAKKDLTESLRISEERLQTLHGNHHKLKGEMTTLQQEHDQTKTTLAETTLSNRNMAEVQAHLKAECASRDEELRSTKCKRDKLNSQLKDAQQDKLNIQHELDEQTRKLEQTERQLLKAKKDIQNLTESLRISEERLQTLHGNHHKLKGEMTTLQHEHDQTKKTLAETTLSNRNMGEVQAHLQAECDKQREEIQQCNQQIEELKKPRKKRIVLGLRSERSGLGKSLVDMVTREMTSRLQKRLDMYNLNLVVSFSQVSSEVTNGFQIALCLNMSRVGTNIVDSIKGMKVDRDLFVMVLHHTNKENLSSLTPTSHRVTGSEVRQLGGILDMAFSSDSGLYDCDLNNAAMDKIAVILKKCLIL